jgi:GNAT superfamily N-acetyltransferase
MPVKIRKAEINDVPAILALIQELAVFEKAPEQVINTIAQLEHDGFGASPLYICFVAELQDQIIGMSFCYTRYSTWKGPCLYLEDLIVTEAYRGKGYGKLLFEYTLQYATSHHYKRLQWQVLDWNESAIDFYKGFNSQFDAEWLNAFIDC